MKAKTWVKKHIMYTWPTVACLASVL